MLVYSALPDTYPRVSTNRNVCVDLDLMQKRLIVASEEVAGERAPGRPSTVCSRLSRLMRGEVPFRLTRKHGHLPPDTEAWSPPA